MRLRYSKQDGSVVELELTEQPITIGRSQDADIVLIDERCSRIHCGVRLWDGEFYLKDLKSKNGTFVNDQRIEVAKLKAGDKIRVGSTQFAFEQDPGAGADTALREIKDEMELGKGYSTLLKEIVSDADDAPARPPAESSKPAEAEAPKPPAARKPIRITIRKKA